MLTSWLHKIAAIVTAGIMLMMTSAHAGNGSSLILSGERGEEIGLLCQYMDTEHEPPPPEAADLCDAAAEAVTRLAVPAGKRLLRLGMRDMTDPDHVPPQPVDPTPAPAPLVDGPILLLVMEARRDWSAPGLSRLLLRVRTARDGVSMAVVGVPPVPVALGLPDWRGTAERRIAQLLDFSVRE